jgi:chemotaxis protein CheD
MMNVVRCSSENRIVVGIGEMALCDEENREIVTFSLGSCLGISIYDPVMKVGGMLHVLLPDSTIQKDRAAVNPLMFVDTGVPRLFRAAYSMGAVKENIIVKVAGGADMRGARNIFNIGERNFQSLQNILRRNNVNIHKQEVGGSISRTMNLNIATGKVSINSPGMQNRFL